MATTRQNHLYHHQNNNTHYENNTNNRSKDGGNSAVMARAREYNRMIEDNNAKKTTSGTSNQQRHPHHQSDDSPRQRQQQQKQEEEDEEEVEDHAVVTPELLVDALSGHEDGLLAIAERLMEHYDEGYDAMGEAIIDAFADVQKLFQHVVEAAHMEGAAYEAQRKEEELQKFKKQHGIDIVPNNQTDNDRTNNNNNNDESMNGNAKHRNSSSPAQPHRHEEFIDEDVRDLLQQAINQSMNIKNKEQLMEIYENACNSASALLPVDSDHRGRLQLSISRSEGLAPDRACTILKYAMDDVLRSHSYNHKEKIPISQRGDCVLEKTMSPSLNNLVDEMKDILSAPVYQDSPVQSVASQFFSELDTMQKRNQSMEERLEHKLASLKAEFLLAREEWEDKHNNLTLQNQEYKKKYDRLLKQQRSNHHYSSSSHHPSSSPSSSHKHHHNNLHNLKDLITPSQSEADTDCGSPRRSAASVASLGSALGQRIFSCGTNASSTSDSRRPPSLVSSHVSRKSKGGGITVSKFLS